MIRSLLQMRFGPTSISSIQTFGVMIVRSALQALLLILLARYLGTSSFSLFAALISLGLGFGMLVSLGQGYLVSVHSAISPEQGERTLSGALPLTACAAFLLFPVYYLAANLLLPGEIQIAAIVLIGFTELGLSPVTQVISKRVHGLGHVPISQAIYAAPIILRLAGVMICMWLIPTSPLTAYSIVHFSSGVLASTLVLVIAGHWSMLPRRYHWPSVVEIQKGLPYAGLRLSTYGPNEVDKIIAPGILSAATAGSYAFASRCLGVIVLPVTALVASTQPRLGALLRDAPARARKLSMAAMATSIGYGTLAGFGLWAAGPYVLNALVGGDYPDLDITVKTLAWACPGISLRYAAGGLLIPLQLPMQRISIELAGILILVILMPTLAHDYGLAGAAAALVVCESAMALALSFASLLALQRRAGQPGI